MQILNLCINLFFVDQPAIEVLVGQQGQLDGLWLEGGVGHRDAELLELAKQNLIDWVLPKKLLVSLTARAHIHYQQHNKCTPTHTSIYMQKWISINTSRGLALPRDSMLAVYS